MPTTQVPPELGSYTANTGIAQISTQQGLGKLNNTPGAGKHVFSNIVLFDLPPRNGDKLGTYSCDLADFKQRDTRRYFICQSGDIITVIADDNNNAKYFYNHTNDSYGTSKLFPLNPYRPGAVGRNILIYIILAILLTIVAAILLRSTNFPAVLITIICFLIPLIPVFISQLVYIDRLAVIEWMKEACAPKVPVQGQPNSMFNSI